MDKLSVLVVDNTSVYKRLLQEAVNATGLAVCDQTASTGALALERLQQKKYDCIILNMLLPEMSGLETLKQIKAIQADLPVIMAGEPGSEHADQIVKALQHGALDFVLKPKAIENANAFEELRSELRMLFTQIQTMRRANILNVPGLSPFPGHSPEPLSNANPASRKAQHRTKPFDLLLITSSTGGPKALETIIPLLPAEFRIPILAVQHMPPLYTRSLAESLNAKSRIRVIEAADGDTLQAGVMLLAPGGWHMRIVEPVPGASPSRYKVALDNGPTVNSVRPSADVLFGSAAQSFRNAHILTVILTGMGSDGLNGVRQLKQACNCWCITQSGSSCVVYGMPKSVHDAGLSDEATDLPDIASRITELVSARS